jgi:hypothetical protein
MRGSPVFVPILRCLPSRVAFLGAMSDFLLSRALLPLIPPTPFSHTGLKGGDSQADCQPFPFHRTHGPIRRYHDHGRIARHGGWYVPHVHRTVAAAADPDPLPALVASPAPRPGPLGLGRPLGGERQSSRAGASARHCRDRPRRHPGGRLGRLDRRPGPSH